MWLLYALVGKGRGRCWDHRAHPWGSYTAAGSHFQKSQACTLVEAMGSVFPSPKLTKTGKEGHRGGEGAANTHLSRRTGHGSQQGRGTGH